ncbi:protein of unknown function [Candidatus Methylomirabilis oxygeniifera]|uniref:Uncharacterized protein n=1 Tax=Methylomirabilis oxygeniifera TaxID=671143 RepID=D5MKB4_METO1|nr:protein of unknown function [Candidatus Methylomirabilis oxyfera]
MPRNPSPPTLPYIRITYHGGSVDYFGKTADRGFGLLYPPYTSLFRAATFPPALCTLDTGLTDPFNRSGLRHKTLRFGLSVSPPFGSGVPHSPRLPLTDSALC